MDENIKPKLEKAIKKIKKSPTKEADDQSLVEKESSAVPEKKSAPLAQSDDILDYEENLEELQTALDNLESTLSENFKQKIELQQTLEKDPKTKIATKKQLKELEKQIIENEAQFKDKQQELYVLQESITCFNAGKKYSPSDWKINPHEMEPIHRAFITGIQSIDNQLPDFFLNKSNMLYQCTKYIEAISIASNLNLTVVQNIDDKVIKNRLDKLFHDYVKIIIIASGKEQPAYTDLIKEYAKKPTINSLTSEDFTTESCALLIAYRSIRNDIVGELILADNESDQILSLFITNLFEDKYNQLQQNEEKESVEVDFIKLYSDIKAIDQIFSDLTKLVHYQNDNVASFAEELNKHLTENQNYATLQIMLHNIQAQCDTFKNQLDSFNNPETPINYDLILALAQNIESLYVFPNEMLLLLDEFEKNYPATNTICDANIITIVYQTLYKLSSYNMMNSIKHALAALTQRLTTFPTQLTEIKVIDIFRNIDFSSLISKVLTPLLTQEELRKEIWQLQENYNLWTSSHKSEATLDKLQLLEKNLPEYQKTLFEASVLRKNILINPYSLVDIKNMYLLIKTHLNMGNDFYMLQQLKTILDNTEEDKISDKNQIDIKTIHEQLTLEATLHALITQTFYSMQNQLDLSKKIVALEIASGDLFLADKKEQLDNIIYTLQHETSPIILIDCIKIFFHQYTSEQRLACLSFIKRYLEIDKNNELVFINFKDSQFIKDIIEFNQNIIVNNQDQEELMQKAQEINELLMSKILEKENTFNQNINDVSQGKVHNEILSRRLKGIYLEITQNYSNMALVKDLLTEVEAIVQAPNLFSKDKDTRDEITTTLNHLCQYLSKSGLFEQTVNNISNQLQQQLENKGKETSFNIIKPLSIERYVLDDIINKIAYNNIAPTEYNALLDLFVDNIESEYHSHFCEISYSELMSYVLDNDPSKVMKGLLPRAKHVRNYMMYNQLVKDYCQMMVFYDHKT